MIAAADQIEIVYLPLKELRHHPSAKLVREMTSEEWGAFLPDVIRRGVQNPIVVQKGGIILDGRHRVRAAEERDDETIPARVVDFDQQEQLEFMLLAALRQRHLTTSERALIAAKLMPAFSEAAKERQSQAGGDKKSEKAEEKSLVVKRSQAIPEGRHDTAAVLAGQAVGVGEATVRRAKAVLEKGIPEVAAAVQAGEMTITKAATIAKLPKEEQAAVMKGEKPAPKSRAADPEPELDRNGQPKSRGVGVQHANEAIDCLKRIPRNDGLSYSTRDGYMDMLEEVYNFKRMKLFPLKVNALQVMRDRNIAHSKSTST